MLIRFKQTNKQTELGSLHIHRLKKVRLPAFAFIFIINFHFPRLCVFIWFWWVFQLDKIRYATIQKLPSCVYFRCNHFFRCAINHVCVVYFCCFCCFTFLFLLEKRYRIAEGTPLRGLVVVFPPFVPLKTYVNPWKLLVNCLSHHFQL